MEQLLSTTTGALAPLIITFRLATNYNHSSDNLRTKKSSVKTFLLSN
uniref:Uncharacterized protein n=1 Tax=Heterorhabditis bacteriophora TaxID=37862 RepID=A0A1I7WGZ0_HETBA